MAELGAALQLIQRRLPVGAPIQSERGGRGQDRPGVGPAQFGRAADEGQAGLEVGLDATPRHQLPAQHAEGQDVVLGPGPRQEVHGLLMAAGVLRFQGPAEILLGRRNPDVGHGLQAPSMMARVAREPAVRTCAIAESAR